MNKIMEEYAGGEEEDTLELQTVATQEERHEERTEAEQPLEKTRKRKRNIEETETEQAEEDKIDEFVLDIALTIMEQTMLQKDFIGERGFNQLISPFREVIEKRGWSLLCEYKPTGFAAVVREFYTKWWGEEEGKDVLCSRKVDFLR